MHPWHRSSSPAAFLRHPRGAHADIRPRLRGERASTMRQDSTLTAILPRLPLGIRAADTQASPRGPYMLAASLPLTRRLCGASLRDPKYLQLPGASVSLRCGRQEASFIEAPYILPLKFERRGTSHPSTLMLRLPCATF